MFFSSVTILLLFVGLVFLFGSSASLIFVIRRLSSHRLSILLFGVPLSLSLAAVSCEESLPLILEVCIIELLMGGADDGVAGVSVTDPACAVGGSVPIAE